MNDTQFEAQLLKAINFAIDHPRSLVLKGKCAHMKIKARASLSNVTELKPYTSSTKLTQYQALPDIKLRKAATAGAGIAFVSPSAIC